MTFVTLNILTCLDALLKVMSMVTVQMSSYCLIQSVRTTGWFTLQNRNRTVVRKRTYKYKYKGSIFRFLIWEMRREWPVSFTLCNNISAFVFCSLIVTCCIQTSRALHWLWGPVWIPKPHVSQWQCAWILCKCWLQVLQQMLMIWNFFLQFLDSK